MRIYITGSVGSGKSTLAKRASKRTGWPYISLDEVVYEEDPTDSWGNKRRPEAEIERRFLEALEQENYIMEDAGRAQFAEGMARADQIVLLDLPLYVRKKRILLRWIKQRLGLEPCIYRPHLKMLRAMFRWLNEYETGRNGTRARAMDYPEKVVVLRSRNDFEVWILGLDEVK